MTKNALADFVTRDEASMEQDVLFVSLLNTLHYRQFAQDDYCVTPRITANLDPRYEIDTSPVQTHHFMRSFVSGAQSTVSPFAPLCPQSNILPTC